jgi:4-amino-4-deoxy-L-arabinose transferase-like glycosyltransferase
LLYPSLPDARDKRSMAVTATATTTRAAGRSVLGLQLLFAILIALKLWFDIAVPPMGDETYYWMWGQRPALSYFDHPPLHAWLLWVVEKFAGWHWWSVRALTWVTLAGTLAIFAAWSKRIMPEDPQRCFWLTAVIYLCTPVFWLMTTMAFNDYLMVFLCFASAHFFLRFTEEWEAGLGRYGKLYAAAFFLGLAVLTKYNAVFLGLGYAAMVLARPQLRRLLLDPHTYAAAVLSIAMQAPVLYWNLTEGMASFQFHLATRLTASSGELHWHYPLHFLANMALVVSPFFFIALFRYPLRAAGNDFERRLRLFALSTFGVSTAAMLVLSLFVYVYFYWNIVGYLALIGIAFRYLCQRWLFRLHAAFGLGMAVLLTVNFTVFPVMNMFGFRDWGTSANFGWDELAAEVADLRTEHPDAFLAGTRYTYAAQLGYQLHTTDVTSLNTLTDQYDFWTDRAALAGKDALIVADGAWPITFAATQFASVQLLQTVTITRLGMPVTDYLIYLGEDYAPTE